MPRKLLSLATIILILTTMLFISTMTLTAAPSANEPAFVAGQLIVKFKADTSPPTGALSRAASGSMEARLANAGVQAVEPLFAESSTAKRTTAGDSRLSRIYRLQLPSNADVLKTVATLSADPAIEWVEPDYIARAATAPNDPLYSEQWGLSKIGAPAAWDVVTGTESVVIAVIDSGIDMTHGDLSAQLWTNPGEIPTNGLDDDNNGYVDDNHGWDFVNDDNDPAEDNGHGTQVAGVAGAAANNGVGIAGVCWQCKIMPVKVMQVGGIANYSDIALGIKYATEKGAEVINLSLGGYSNSATLQEAIQDAVNEGIVVVAGAGNDNVSTPFYPAAYDDVLAVAATTLTDTKATFSDYGDWVDIAAPGQSITTTFLGGDWGVANGTSFAAPFASGVAGLLLSEHPTWSESLVRAQLIHTADDIDDPRLGSGRLNAATAVTQTPHPQLTIVDTAVNGDPTGHPTAGENATVQVTIGNDWLDATGTTGVLSTADSFVTINTASASFGDIAARGTGTSSPVYSITVAAGAGYSHPIPFTLDVSANGGAYNATLAFTVTTRSADEHVGGTIAADTVWTNDKTYIVDSNIGVAPGYTLTIQSGTEVRFNGAYDFSVGGTLIADGTADAPIVFRSNIDSDWGRINFTTDSVDTAVDANYNYISGNILRYVTIEDSSGGIFCDNATPYLSHLTVTGGGLTCTPGTLMVGSMALPGMVLLDNSDITGGVNITGMAQLTQNILNGNVSVSGQSTVLTNIIQGNLSVGGGSLVQENTVQQGSITGGKTVINNHVNGGGIGFSLSAGEYEQLVLSNTIRGGGISVGLLAQVHGNDIQDANGWGISSQGFITATNNRLVGNASGIKVDGALLRENLIANNSGTGLEINGNAAVISNTFTGNSGSAIKITSGSTVQITSNNLEWNTGTYDIENLTTADIAAQNNWWGTTDSTTIGGRIFDYYDGDFNKGKVQYTPAATAPVQTAPAYVRSVTLDPGSPVGIQQVVFDVKFSRPMEPGSVDAKFYTTRKGTWQTYNTSNSGLPDNNVPAVTTDSDEAVWFGTWGGAVRFDRADWTTYTRANSNLPDNNVLSITMAPDGAIWFGTYGGGAARFDGANWTIYSTANSGLPTNEVYAIAVAPNGEIWFGTLGGAARFNGVNWTTYTPSNSGLPDDYVQAIAVTPNGEIWFGTYGGGAARFDGVNWTTYTPANSGLPDVNVRDITATPDGTVWFGTYGGAARLNGANWTTYNMSTTVFAIAIASDEAIWFGKWGGGGGATRFDGTYWTVYDTTNSGLPDSFVRDIATTPDGTVWFGTYGGVGVLWGATEYSVMNNAQWLSPTTYRATYDISTLVPRDSYSITVQGAVGTDGIEIAPNSAFTFTVDYAGGVSDTTPPPAPAVMAEGIDGDASTVQVSWSASDPDSNITGYRYAIGSTQGGTDIINWTETSVATLSLTGLGLIPGERYWITVQARNEGGLYSEAGYSSFVAGQENPKVYLPLVLK